MPPPTQVQSSVVPSEVGHFPFPSLPYSQSPTGIAVLAILGFALLFCVRRRRTKDLFDGDFDPDRVVSGRPGSGTLPGVKLTTDDDTDDGMGGRLANGVSGIVTPFTYKPSPLSQATPMRQTYGDIGTGAGAAAAYSNSAPSNEMSPPHSPPQSPPPGSHYSGDGYGAAQTYYAQPGQHLHPGVPVGGYLPAGAGQQADWRGVSPGPSVGSPPSSTTGTNTSANGGGGFVGARSTKEREAFGRYGARPGGMGVANPEYDPSLREMSEDQQSGGYGDPGQAYSHGGRSRGSASVYSEQSYGSGQGQGQQGYAAMPGGPPAAGSSAGRRTSAVVVHQDGGRVEMRSKAQEAAEEAQEEPQEIPPTYDSIPGGQR